MEIRKSRIILRNVSFVFLANLFSTIVSAILSIYIPRELNVSSYGYWQLNLLFTGYIALLHFGWVDGAYIRYAGTKFSELDRLTHKSQFYGLLLFQFIISLLAILLCIIFIEDSNRLFAIGTVFVYSLFTIPNSYLLYLLQGGGLVKEYSFSTILNKLVYISICVLLLCLRIYDFKLIIIASLIGTIVSFSYTLWVSKWLFSVRGVASSNQFFKETVANVSCGVKISIAFISGNLIVGAVRYMIENKWGVETFGRASLTISLTHVVMIFINAVGIVILPILRNVSEQTKKDTYIVFSHILLYVVLLTFILYYPLSVFLTKVLPQYTESIYWMSLIFPICLFEARMGMLNNTYLKGLRKENILMWINIGCCLLAIILSYIFVFVIGDFVGSMLIIVLSLAIRCTIADISVLKQLNLKKRDADIFAGLFFSILFILLNSVFKGNETYSLIILSIAILIYFIISFSEVKMSYKWIKTILSR